MQQAARRIYLLYHELRPAKSEYSYVLGTNAFARHVELFAALRERQAPILPEITFDDGHRSNFEYAAPVLDAKGLKGTFFITAGWTGSKRDFMGWDELRSLLQSGHRIGAHGWSHKLLTHCNESELAVELRDAKHALEDNLGAPVTTMSLPGGRYNKAVLTACKSAGYTQIFTSVPQAEPEPAGEMVGRLNILSGMTLEWIDDLFRPASTTLTKLGRQYRIKETAKTLLGDRLYERVWALANRREPEPDME